VAPPVFTGHLSRITTLERLGTLGEQMRGVNVLAIEALPSREDDFIAIV
jgi:hypothetical protein